LLRRRPRAGSFLFRQSRWIVDGDVAATGPDVPTGRKLTHGARDHLARRAEMRRDFLLRHLHRPVARRVQQQKVGEAPLQLV